MSYVCVCQETPTYPYYIMNPSMHLNSYRFRFSVFFHAFHHVWRICFAMWCLNAGPPRWRRVTPLLTHPQVSSSCKAVLQRSEEIIKHATLSKVRMKRTTIMVCGMFLVASQSQSDSIARWSYISSAGECSDRHVKDRFFQDDEIRPREFWKRYSVAVESSRLVSESSTFISNQLCLEMCQIRSWPFQDVPLHVR